jgi:radical SAM protein with 4Fe4S-binding SPASM domain
MLKKLDINGDSAFSSDKLFLGRNIILRKEHFGGLILMRTGRRYYISHHDYNRLINILKNNNQLTKSMNSYKNDFFIKELLKKKILSFEKTNGKYVENKSLGRMTLSFPKIVYFEITNRCNLACKHCYSRSSPLEKDVLDKDTIKRFIDECAAHGLEFLSIGGGEPLLRADLYELVKYIINKDIEVEISTNGLLITEDVARKLKSANLQFIQVSLDAADSETFFNIRGSREFNKVLESIKILSKYFIVTVSCTLNKYNQNQLEEIIKLSVKSNAKYFRITKLMEAGRGKINKDRLAISARSIDLKLKFLKSLQEKYPKIRIDIDENLQKPTRRAIHWLPKGYYGCAAGRTTCSIDGKGNIYPCSFLNFPEFNCGNIRKEKFIDIWRKSKVLKNFRTLKKIDGECSNCKHIENCLGGCRADAYYKTGKINKSLIDCVMKNTNEK